jgi:hypothetical protein
MSVFVYSISLLLIGGIIAVSFSTGAGLLMVGVALVGIFFSLLRLAEAGSTTMTQDDIDRHMDEVLRHHPR